MGHQPYLSSIRTTVRDRSLFIALWGGGRGRWAAEDLWLNKVKFSRSPFCLNVTSLKWSPLKTFDDFSDPPPFVFIFQANLSGPLSESFQSFQRSSLLGSQLRLIPPFVLPKIKWSPPKSSPPPAINNDRSLKLTGSHTPGIVRNDVRSPTAKIALGLIINMPQGIILAISDRAWKILRIGLVSYVVHRHRCWVNWLRVQDLLRTVVRLVEICKS